MGTKQTPQEKQPSRTSASSEGAAANTQAKIGIEEFRKQAARQSPSAAWGLGGSLMGLECL